MPTPHGPWSTVSRRHVFAGGPLKDVSVETVRLPGGRLVDDYYTVRMADFALVYARTNEGQVLMLRQYRHGPRRVCLTFPGGHLESSEPATAAARRELLEETGYEAERWSDLGSYVTNANQGCSTAYFFRADGCTRVRDPGSQDLEAAELLLVPEGELLRPGRLEEIGLTSHVALLAIATHPHLRA